MEIHLLKNVSLKWKLMLGREHSDVTLGEDQRGAYENIAFDTERFIIGAYVDIRISRYN